MADESHGLDRRTVLKIGAGGAAAGITGFAGCNGNGSNGDGTTSSSSSSSSSSSGSDEPIRIGAAVPKTGAYSSTGEALIAGYEMGVEYINDNGGIGGREVELILKDDESDPKKTRSKLQQIVSNNDVSMLWGSFSSLLVTAGSAFAEQQKLPFLGSTFAYMAPHQNKNYEWTFAPFAKSRDIANNTKAWFDSIEDGPQKLAIWELNTGWGGEMADQWAQTLGDAGYEVVLREKYQLHAKDFSTLISQTQSAGADAVLSNPIPPDGITAVKQMKETGWTPKLVDFVRACDPRAWGSALGSTGDYVASTGPGWEAGLDTTGTADLVDRYHQRDGVSADTVPVDVVGDSFALTQVAAGALSAAESTENTAIQDALLNEQFDTVIGNFGFDENGIPTEGQLVPAVGQWQDGNPMLVHPETDSEYYADTVYPMPAFDER